jgi:hypothetical protein
MVQRDHLPLVDAAFRTLGLKANFPGGSKTSWLWTFSPTCLCLEKGRLNRNSVGLLGLHQTDLEVDGWLNVSNQKSSRLTELKPPFPINK